MSTASNSGVDVLIDREANSRPNVPLRDQTRSGAVGIRYTRKDYTDHEFLSPSRRSPTMKSARSWLVTNERTNTAETAFRGADSWNSDVFHQPLVARLQGW